VAYTKSELERDVERLLRDMANELERKADCDECDDGDVSISNKDGVARDYARKVADVVSSKLGRAVGKR
jgi:hypothetical protein